MTDTDIASLTSRLEAAERAKEFSDLADDLWHAAEVRGIAMWREAHPGKELNLPDAAQYTFWLIHELGEARQAASVEATERRRAHAARDVATAERDDARHEARLICLDLDAATAEAARLKRELQEIADADGIDLALDPEWPQRIARAALNAAPSKEGDGE